MIKQHIARVGIIAAGLMIAMAAFSAPLQASGYMMGTALTGEVECQQGGDGDCPTDGAR
jgi:hypothetical protein